MNDIHIDEFYQDCVKTLVQLYNSFPRLTTLYVDDLITNAGTDEYGIPNRRHKACFDAMLWLASEGYIRYQDTIRQDALDQVVLTEKSFLRLSLPTTAPDNPDNKKNDLPPSVARKQATMAWHCRQALNNKGSEAIARAALQFFTEQ
ncbi:MULTISPECIES: hypothetical protein [Endozoicomonas]|uniref:hypothetical protein n=1 Tax=Endozoicomonas TaxID=305899 RepID=UPI0013CF937F|nr:MULTISPECIES: hypothetical protein [Endozoicomonas]WBA80550.1 hypothetical protein O2T12_19770 [Endozoicomonas sp. GU-1]WBA88116.1 hypothetical protein O3276_08975 [Endozoicomonas sp. GU-1]